MKALPKLMKNSSLSIEVVSEEMPKFHISIQGSTSWPSLARFDSQTRTLSLFDAQRGGSGASGATGNRAPSISLKSIYAAKMRDRLNFTKTSRLLGDGW
jgi:hypothetical protein